jgi:hypothetical protein
MTAEQVRDRLIELMTAFHDASLHQPPYKTDLFALCREAKRWRRHRPDRRVCLSADAIYDMLRERWAANDALRLRKTEQLREMWREWLYALDR